MSTQLVVALVLAASQSTPLLLRTPGFLPLFNGKNLEGWELPGQMSDRFVVADGVLQIRGTSGWLLTSRTYDDFVLTFEVRQIEPDSVAGVLVRTLFVPNHRLAYEVQVANGQEPSPVLLQHRDLEVIPGAKTPVALVMGDDQWHHYRVEVIENRVRVLRDGLEVDHLGGGELTTGRIGLHATRGVVGWRKIQIEEIALSPLTEGQGFARCGDLSVVCPRPTHEERPRYPVDSHRLGVQGDVWLNCVVETDGHVEQCVVARRLFHELEVEALRATKQWRFEPGTLHGKPVPVVVVIAMTFKLK